MYPWDRVLTEQILYGVDFMCLNKFWKIMLVEFIFRFCMIDLSKR